VKARKWEILAVVSGQDQISEDGNTLYHHCGGIMVTKKWCLEHGL
jgi:hypothetical protein